MKSSNYMPIFQSYPKIFHIHWYLSWISFTTACGDMKMCLYFLYARRKTGRIMEWPCPCVRPSTITCERDILKTACGIEFTFWFDLKTSDAIDLGHSMKTKMAATAVWRLALYPMQDIACEHDIFKTDCRIDFTFSYGLNTTKTLDAIDFGHSMKTKMAATAVGRLTLYPMQDIACERDSLKTACWIDLTFSYGLNTIKAWDAIDFGHSTKTKMATRAVWRLTLYPMQDISCECGSLKTACRIDFTFW